MFRDCLWRVRTEMELKSFVIVEGIPLLQARIRVNRGCDKNNNGYQQLKLSDLANSGGSSPPYVPIRNVSKLIFTNRQQTITRLDFLVRDLLTTQIYAYSTDASLKIYRSQSRKNLFYKLF